MAQDTPGVHYATLNDIPLSPRPKVVVDVNLSRVAVSGDYNDLSNRPKVGYSLVYMGAANDGPLTDKAVNIVEITQQEALFTLPAASESIARDFYVHMNVVSSGCRVQFLSAVWDCSGIDPNAYYDQCTYLLHFLEVGNNTFHVLDVSAVSRIEKALKSGPHVQNPSTGLWHRLIAQTDSQGRISIGVDQAGVASWPHCQCDDDSGSDSSSY